MKKYIVIVIAFLILAFFVGFCFNKPVTTIISKPGKTKYELKVDTIQKEIVKIRTIKQSYFDTIVEIRDSIVYFESKLDTSGIVRTQKKLIVAQDSTIMIQESIITMLDTITVNLNKSIDIYKDSIVDLNLVVDKKNKKLKRNRIISAVAVLVAGGLLLK